MADDESAVFVGPYTDAVNLDLEAGDFDFFARPRRAGKVDMVARVSEPHFVKHRAEVYVDRRAG